MCTLPTCLLAQEVNEPLYDGAPVVHAVVALAGALSCHAAVQALQALAAAAGNASHHEPACEDMEDVDDGFDDDAFVSVEEDDRMLVQVMQQYSRWQQHEAALAAQDTSSAYVVEDTEQQKQPAVPPQARSATTSLASSRCLTCRRRLAFSPLYAPLFAMRSQHSLTGAHGNHTRDGPWLRRGRGARQRLLVAARPVRL